MKKIILSILCSLFFSLSICAAGQVFLSSEISNLVAVFFLINSYLINLLQLYINGWFEKGDGKYGN